MLDTLTSVFTGVLFYWPRQCMHCARARLVGKLEILHVTELTTNRTVRQAPKSKTPISSYQHGCHVRDITQLNKNQQIVIVKSLD